tara:strand:+ start:546 stop:758 length:213 start_codon:yes stop_codon:yes gene_type:complete
MESIVETFLIILLEFILIIPGACIRWLYLKFIGKPKPLKEIISDNPIINGVVGALFIVGLSLILIELFSS